MIHETSASITLEHGPVFEIVYKWMVLNDGGDYHLVAWEPLPPEAPKDAVPDMILNVAVATPSQGEYMVRRQVQDALATLTRGYMTIRCVSCED